MNRRLHNRRAADAESFLAELNSALRARAWLPAAAGPARPQPAVQHQLLQQHQQAARPDPARGLPGAPPPPPYPPPSQPQPPFPGGGAPPDAAGGAAATGQVGVAAVLGRVRDTQRQLDGTMETAFRDLSGLMEKAREMVEISQRLRATLQAAPAGQGASEAEMQEFEARGERKRKRGAPSLPCCTCCLATSQPTSSLRSFLCPC